MLVRETNPSYIPKTPIMIEIVNIRHVKPHRHNDAIEFIYCMSGSVKMTIAHQKINIYENELVTVDHDDIHYMTADTDNIVLIIHIDLKNIRHQWEDIQYIFFSCATGLARPDQKRAMEEIYDIMMALAYTYMTQRESAVQVYKNMSDRLIDILLEKFCWFSVEGLTSEENEKYRSRLNNIGAYIQKNYKEKITISQLAKHEFIGRIPKIV